MTPREETAEIIILVPNEGLNDSSRGNCRIVMPQSGVGATPHKGLIKDNHNEYPGARTVPGILNNSNNIKG